MTDTDMICVATMETMKKYSPEQAVEALAQYTKNGQPNYFTSTNGARNLIKTVGPVGVMSDVLKSSIRYEEVFNEKGWARPLANPDTVNKALSEYYQGNKISVNLKSAEVQDVMLKITQQSIDDALNLLAANPEFYRDVLSQYIACINNFRQEFNKIPVPEIDEYFEQFKKQEDKSRGQL